MDYRQGLCQRSLYDKRYCILYIYIRYMEAKKCLSYAELAWSLVIIRTYNTHIIPHEAQAVFKGRVPSGQVHSRMTWFIVIADKKVDVYEGEKQTLKQFVVPTRRSYSEEVFDAQKNKRLKQYEYSNVVLDKTFLEQLMFFRLLINLVIGVFGSSSQYNGEQGSEIWSFSCFKLATKQSVRTSKHF